jgi:hypothetical protein
VAVAEVQQSAIFAGAPTCCWNYLRHTLMKVEKHFKEWEKLEKKVRRRKKWSDLVSKIYSPSNDAVKEAKEKNSKKRRRSTTVSLLT